MSRVRIIAASSALVGAVVGLGATGNASTVPDSTMPASTVPDSSAAPDAAPSIGSLRFIGEQVISNLTMVDGTLVGGLSGITFNLETGSYVIISDDRSDNNPARFYDASLTFDETTFESVEIAAAHTFLQADGTPYPNEEQGGAVPDPEAIRIDPNDGSVWWTSEGSHREWAVRRPGTAALP